MYIHAASCHNQLLQFVCVFGFVLFLELVKLHGDAQKVHAEQDV